MSDPEPEEDNRGADETLPRGINEPGSAEPEADTLEQQLPPESGEDTGQGDSYPEEPVQGESPESALDARDADVIEQQRVVEPDEDDYRE